MADAYYAHATMPGARILFAKPPIGFPRGTCQGRIMESALCIRQILFPCLLADERKPRHCETLLIPAAFKPVLNPLDTSIFIFSLHISRRLVSPRVNGISESFRRTWSTRWFTLGISFFLNFSAVGNSLFRESFARLDNFIENPSILGSLSSWFVPWL